MASDKNGADKSERAGLPFEPKRTKRSDKSAENSVGQGAKSSKAQLSEAQPSKANSKSSDKARETAKKADKEKSAVSPKAQARVEEIRAMKQRRAQKDAQKDTQRDGQRTGRSTGDRDGEIPKAVSQRMLRRMAFFSGMPVALGVGIFFLSYYLLSRQIAEFAPVAVLLVTMGCFGLGVLGLTYGVLSASWDEEPGGLIGLKEFKLNFGRAVESWRAGKSA